jgi:hypothetical protein
MTDERTIQERHMQLTWDILSCDNMIDDEDPDHEHQADLQSELEGMCQELSMIEEVMFLTQPVDCDCFYAPR